MGARAAGRRGDPAADPGGPVRAGRRAAVHRHLPRRRRRARPGSACRRCCASSAAGRPDREAHGGRDESTPRTSGDAVGDVDAAVRVIVDHYELRGRHRAADARPGGRRRRGPQGHRARRADAPRLGRGGLRAAPPDDEALVDLLVVATDVYTWKLLRRDRGLSRADTEQRMTHLVTACSPPHEEGALTWPRSSSSPGTAAATSRRRRHRRTSCGAAATPSGSSATRAARRAVDGAGFEFPASARAPLHAARRQPARSRWSDLRRPGHGPRRARRAGPRGPPTWSSSTACCSARWTRRATDRAPLRRRSSTSSTPTTAGRFLRGPIGHRPRLRGYAPARPSTPHARPSSPRCPSSTRPARSPRRNLASRRPVVTGEPAGRHAAADGAGQPEHLQLPGHDRGDAEHPRRDRRPRRLASWSPPGPVIDAGALRTSANARGARLRRPRPADARGRRLVVGHGGHATTMRALAHDLPLLVMPMHPMLDQPMVGAGGRGRRRRTRGSRRAATPTRSGAAVDELLADGPHRAAAARLGAAIRRDAAAPRLRAPTVIEAGLTD